MKKMLTLLLVAGVLATTAQAQISREDARRVILGGGNNNGSPNDRDVIFDDERNDDRYGGSRQAEIDRVNRQYDAKIQSIRNNRYLSNEEKQRAIRQLERDRQQRIRELSRGYDRNRNRDFENDDDDDRYERRRNNNGRHKGWYKKGKNKNWKNGQRRNRDWDDE